MNDDVGDDENDDDDGDDGGDDDDDDDLMAWQWWLEHDGCDIMLLTSCGDNPNDGVPYSCSTLENNLSQQVWLLTVILEDEERFCMRQFFLSFPSLKAYRAIAKLTSHLQKKVSQAWIYFSVCSCPHLNIVVAVGVHARLIKGLFKGFLCLLGTSTCLETLKRP